MKYFYKLTSNLTFSFALLCVSAQETITSSDDYLQKSFERSVQEISSEKEIRSELHFRGLNQESLRAPNSYIYDLELAKTNHYGGLKIPVAKAFAMWENADWYLNQPLNSSRTLSTYVYWEDVPGLIQSVEMENAAEKENSKIVVKVNPKKGMGNALVSLHLGNNGNSDDPIVWSWHIWVTDDPSNGVSYGQDIETDKNGNLFTPKYMDRNLGAVYNDILGHNWHKTSGLMYQWGRKDPIPPMVYKDFSFYEITGLVGVIRNREDGSRGNKLPEYMRPFENISHNLRLSVKNPLAYLLNSDAGTWFSSQQYRVPNSNPANVMAWDLWSDNYRGGNSNAGSSNAAVRSDSRSYELKSPYDPCPNGWRIPSYLGRVTVNNNLSPWGRKNSGANDDTSPPTNMFYHNAPNNFILNAKVHSGLGVDFTGTHTSSNVTRDIGKIPMTGYYVLYPNNGNPTVVFQDENAIAAFWTATYSLGGARYMRVVTDPLRPDLSIFGLNQILINQTSQSQEAMAVRCMEDPNLFLSGDFQTEYIPTSKTYFTDGLTNPNSYIINGETELLIPVNKAFSAYEQLFPEKNALPDNELIAHVYWADNPQLVQTVKIIESGGDPKNDFIRVQLNAGQRGNAVISLHNESISNPVYWSWHLWAVADEIQEITYVNQEVLATTHNFINTTGTENPVLTTTFMDRNLGAVHDLPMEILSNPNSPELKNEVKLSGGLHYQWGRKDPIPSFRLVGGDPYEIYYGRMVNDQGIVTYSTLNQLTYLNLFTKIYSNYRSESAIEPGDNKYQEADKIIQYSVRNPLTFMHKGTTISTDWVSSNLAVHSNRWGHGEGKSIYDPCPAGWRVPDTFKAHQSGKGSSPWFNGKKLGSLQGSAHLMEIHYDGQFAQSDGKPAGWFFTDPDYQIGNFPTTGIIGKFSPNSIGGTDNAQAITGVWTASLTQQLKGHALAMSIGKLTDSSHRVISTGNISPAYGLNVRCAKDEIRYDGNVGTDYFNLEKREFTQSVLDETIQFYPNPVADYLNTSSSENLEIEIFDRYGKLVLKSKFQNQKVDIRSLEKGIYIGLINAPDTSEILTIKIFKR